MLGADERKVVWVLPTDPVDLKETIYDVKKRLHEVSGTPPDKQVLFFGGKELDECKTLSEEGIRYGDLLQFTIMVRRSGSRTHP